MDAIGDIISTHTHTSIVEKEMNHKNLCDEFDAQHSPEIPTGDKSQTNSAEEISDNMKESGFNGNENGNEIETKESKDVIAVDDDKIDEESYVVVEKFEEVKITHEEVTHVNYSEEINESVEVTEENNYSNITEESITEHTEEFNDSKTESFDSNARDDSVNEKSVESDDFVENKEEVEENVTNGDATEHEVEEKMTNGDAKEHKVEESVNGGSESDVNIIQCELKNKVTENIPEAPVQKSYDNVENENEMNRICKKTDDDSEVMNVRNRIFFEQKPAKDNFIRNNKDQNTKKPVAMSTSMDSDTIRAAYDDVRADNTETQWAVFKFDGPRIICSKTGYDFNKFKDQFGENERAFGYLRVQTGDEMSKRQKFLFITWIGNGVGVLKRAKMSTDKSVIKGVISNFAVELQLEHESELDEGLFVEALNKAGGANYGTGVREL